MHCSSSTHAACPIHLVLLDLIILIICEVYRLWSCSTHVLKHFQYLFFPECERLSFTPIQNKCEKLHACIVHTLTVLQCSCLTTTTKWFVDVAHYYFSVLLKMELCNLYASLNVIRVIKARNMAWVDITMHEDEKCIQNFGWNPDRKKPRGRSRHRWEGNNPKIHCIFTKACHWTQFRLALCKDHFKTLPSHVCLLLRFPDQNFV